MGDRKARTSKARMVTRKTNELSNAIKLEVHSVEINEKIRSLKFTMGELGELHDAVIENIPEGENNETEVAHDDEWYYRYDVMVDNVIKDANEYVIRKETPIPANEIPISTGVKLKKLEIPIFNSDHREYFKWKEMFERYTRKLDELTRYDYLFNHTKGESHGIIRGKQNYKEAIDGLDREFGNKTYAMKLLIDDIRRLGLVRKGDHKTFEKLSREVNGFKDRLTTMGKANEVENTYVLQEIEGKLCHEDKQKWLESMGSNIDDRTVGKMCEWLEYQAHLRRLISNQNVKSEQPTEGYRKTYLSNPTKQESSENCLVCGESHLIKECPKFIGKSVTERWEFVKRLYLCFNCLSRNHKSFECMSTLCSYCNRPHHELLHNTNLRNPYNSNPARHKSSEFVNENKEDNPSRAYLPIFRAKSISNEKTVNATVPLDSASELVIMSRKLANSLKLKGTPIVIETIGVGAIVTQQITEKVEFFLEDRMGNQVFVEAIVLEKACGRAIPIPVKTVEEISNKLQINMNHLYTKGGEIDLLVGMSVPQLHKQISFRDSGNGLSIMETRFGPCIVGRSVDKTIGNYIRPEYNVQFVSYDKEIDLWKFVEAEVSGITKECPCVLKTDEEIKYNKVMEDSWNRVNGGCFEVRLPWKIDPSTLPNNRCQAIQRDLNLQKQLAKNIDVQELFASQIDEMVQKGILRKVSDDYPSR